MTKAIPHFFVSAFCSIATHLFAQTSVDIPAAKDNTLYESSAGDKSNGAGAYFFVGRTNQGLDPRRRALLAFDISASLPPDATIESVVLNLNMSRANAIGGEQIISLHTVLQDWGEGDSNAQFEEGGGVAATPGDATWIYSHFDTTAWNTPGGEYTAEASVTQAVNNIGPYSWSSAQITADVQSWLDNPEGNFGWILIGGEESNGTSKRFDSKEIGTEQNRPVLSVTYTDNTTSVASPVAPTRFHLEQSYPNPINADRLRKSGASLGFTLERPALVSLAVYNILGQNVINLKSDEQMPSGGHVVVWDGHDAFGQHVPPGVYLYTLKTPDGRQTRRILISR
jgi:hypothetical protein